MLKKLKPSNPLLLQLCGITLFIIGIVSDKSLFLQTFGFGLMIFGFYKLRRQINHSIKNKFTIEVTKLDFARDVSKRLDEHRELVESIQKNTLLLETHPWHINHLSTQDDYLMWLFYLRNGEWPIQGKIINGNFPVDMAVRPRPEILGQCKHPQFPR